MTKDNDHYDNQRSAILGDDTEPPNLHSKPTKVRKPVLNPTAKDMADFNLSRLFYVVKDALSEILRLWDKYSEPAPDPRKNPNYWEQQAEHIAVELFAHSDVNEILSRLVATAGRNNAKIFRKLNNIVKDE